MTSLFVFVCLPVTSESLPNGLKDWNNYYSVLELIYKLTEIKLMIKVTKGVTKVQVKQCMYAPFLDILVSRTLRFTFVKISNFLYNHGCAQ